MEECKPLIDGPAPETLATPAGARRLLQDTRPASTTSTAGRGSHSSTFQLNMCRFSRLDSLKSLNVSLK